MSRETPITETEGRRHAEEELKRQTAHLDELFELAPHAVVLVDAEVRVIRVNREFIRMFGYTAQEAEGRPLQELVAPEERLAEYRNNARLLSGGQKVESETIRRRKDGARIAVSMVASPVLTAGPIEGYIIYRDITERKRDEALLAGEKRVLEMIATGEPLLRTLEELCLLVEEQSPGALCSILLLDGERKRLRHGVAPHLPAGYTAALDGRAIGPEEGPCGIAAYRGEPVILDDVLAAPLPEEFQALAAGHGLRACWSIPLVALDQRVLGTFAVYYRTPRRPTPTESDMLEQFRHLASIAIERVQSQDALDRARAELARASRVTTVGQMAASVAHEINQPLAAVLINANACLRWLDAEPPNLQGAADAARRILRDGQRAGDVIGRLRSLFRGSAPATEPLPVNEVVREVLAIARVELQNAGVTIRTKLAEGLPPALADRVQLQQMLLNLILNATEAMSGVRGRPRELTLCTEPGAAGEVRVLVRDTGVGIAPESAERIFDPFYSTKREGMGMGLAIGRSIAESHGGYLRAEPHAGPGATFVFALPTAPAAAGPP